MKSILFCQNNYAFGILEPLKQALNKNGYEYIWYVAEKITKYFPFTTDNYTNKISDLERFNADAIFVPGNAVPHYLRGLKVQIFHGLAGEKKGHFRIRHYFDLYLTQGPYFTNKFNDLKLKYRNFDVTETGWPKLDIYGTDKNKFNHYKAELLKKHNATKVILYAPTFSPKLTSAPFLIEEIKKLASHPDFVILLKFHPLMAEEWIKTYKAIATQFTNILFQEEKNIIKYLLVSDLLISDTSSVIYEFLLLNKPIITFRNISKNIQWDNALEYKKLSDLVFKNLTKDPFKKQRIHVKEQYHPYSDGKSAIRMINAVKDIITSHGVPERRKLPYLRRLKIYSIFGKPAKK